ncbi:MAG: MazG nucleotide pyrophosphohydrolase domain-containing protein [Promethearchaeota archaeon]
MANHSIHEFQELMFTLYGERDQKRGIEKSLLWLYTEIGELIEAYLNHDQNSLEEEVADVFAWLCSICNLLNIDIETAAWRKYPSCCPKCSANPCSCPPL